MPRIPDSHKRTLQFLIVKNFQPILGYIRSIRKLQSRYLFMDVSLANQPRLHSNCIEISFFFVSVQVHPTLNTIHDVMSAPDFLYSTKERLENLK